MKKTRAPTSVHEPPPGAARAPRHAWRDGTMREELTYRLRQQHLVSDFGLEALRTTDAQLLRQSVCRIAAQGLHVDLAKFLAFRSEHDDFLVVAGVGWREGTIGHATLAATSASAAGYAFLTERPVLSNHLTGEQRFRTPELLVDHGVRRAINVPVRDGGTPVGVLEVDSRERDRFTDADIAFLEALGNVLAVALRRLDAEAVLAEVSARETHLMGELRHRVRNIFTVMRGLVAMSRREVMADGGDLAELVLGRLEALSAAAEAGLPDLNDGVGHGAPAQVATLVEKVLAPYAGQVELRPPERPAAPLAGDRQTPLALLLHELATNALKHGALARDGGTVTLAWVQDDRDLRLDWREAMPETDRPVAEPKDGGFGAGMIDRLVGATQGRIDRRWTPRGLEVTVVLPPRD